MRITQWSAVLGMLGAVIWRSCVLKYCVTDPDIWWHLKVGDWILANHSVPRTGIFSRTAAGAPWVAYSWGYEVLLSLAHRWLGLIGIGIFGVLLTVLVAYVIFLVLHRVCGSVWIACGLSAATCFSMLFTMMPRPHFFSIILFTLELGLILEAQRKSSITPLRWLPLLFLVWANLHIQFVYGLLALGLFVAVQLLQRAVPFLGRFSRDSEAAAALPVKSLFGILALSALATLIGPNTYHVYEVILTYSRESFGYLYIKELQALDFRFADHYGQLLLTGLAFFVLGWQKKTDPFKSALLVVCALIAFRTTRDGWFICIPAAACIADALYDAESESEQRHNLLESGALLAGVAVLMAILIPSVGFTTRSLDRAVSNAFPVAAGDYLRRYPLPGPIYNSFNWGGFLIWYLPEYPVAIDGRNDLYGDSVDLRYMGIQNGLKPYSGDPDFRQAGFFLLNSREYLVTRLSRDANYQMIYQDPLAVVFVPVSHVPSGQ